MWECGKHLYNGFVFTIFGNMGNLEDANYGLCKIDAKNRITLPKKVLDLLNIDGGDFVCIERVDDNICIHKAYFCVRKKNGGGIDGNGKKD